MNAKRFTGKAANWRKNHGFIEPDPDQEGLPVAGNVFVYHEAIEMDGFRILRDGERVSFEVGPGIEPGLWQALKVRREKKPGAVVVSEVRTPELDLLLGFGEPPNDDDLGGDEVAQVIDQVEEVVDRIEKKKRSGQPVDDDDLLKGYDVVEELGDDEDEVH